jgi:TRAP-type mannitol/chloroaromatic compound transport system substrate-binding protein
MKNVRIKSLIGTLGVLVISLMIVGLAHAKTINWKMATGRTPALTPHHEGDLRFAEMVNKMSGGRLHITVHSAGELMPAFEIFDGVRKGVIQVAGAWSTYWTGKNTAFDLFCSLGFMMTAPDWMTWMYEGGGLELGQELYAKYGIKYFPFSVLGPESGFRTNKPIRTLEDFKGIKLRTGVLQTIAVLEQIGAKPARIPGGEIYMALKLGTIDGAEFSVPSTDWSMKFQENTKYVMSPAGWYQVGTMGDLMINMDAWKKLSPDLQAIIENAAMSNMVWTYAKTNWETIGALKKFKEAGIETIELDQEAQEKLEELSIQFMEEESVRNPDYGKIAKSIINYLKGFDNVRKSEGRFKCGTTLKRYPEIK